MGVLDQVMQMKSQGRNDSEIINDLQTKGVSPKEIQDALNQAQVKRAISANPAENMQQSIMENPPEPVQMQGMEEQDQTAQAPGLYAQEAGSYETPYAQQQEYYGGGEGEYYGEGYGEGYGSGGTSDTGTLIEIAEQVFADKVKKILRALEDVVEFKTLTGSKMNLFEERLKRIESTIDQLQISILEKIGSYGQNLEGIKKEMSMMQDSFGKVVNTTLDKKSKRRI